MFQRILIVFDLNRPLTCARLFSVALELANGSAKISLATVISGFEMAAQAQWSPIGYRQRLERARFKLDCMAAKSGAEGHLETYVSSGRVSSETLLIARRTGADLIVMATHRNGLIGRLLADDAARVLRHAHCSVLAVRD